MSTYSEKEEKLNVITHALGLILSIIGFVMLYLRAQQNGDTLTVIGAIIFGVSLIILYAASTFYHNAKNPILRAKLNILDHAAIFLLIAGTYTPLCLITLQDSVGWTIFYIVWGIACIGIPFKIFYTGKYELISTALYLIMGWIIVFAVQPLWESLPEQGIYWIVAGGLSYTLGAVFFSIDRIKYNHAIFHIFVLIGSFCHFYAIYQYVLPSP